MLEVGFSDAARAATQSGRRRLLLAVVIATSMLTVLAAAFTAAGASAAFSVTDWKVTPSNLQAGQHPNVNLKIAADPVAGDQTGDDLKSAQLDLPSGLLVNPQAVATPCTASQLSIDNCPAASQVGKISVQYRIGGSLVTSNGSVYSTTPAANSVINFGFVVRPTSNYQKFFFSSGITTGLTTVRSGPDQDFGLSISVPSIPNTVKYLGFSLAMTISNISIDLYPRSGATQTGPYFTFNPTRCTPANSRAVLTSYKAVSVTRTASFTPTACNTPRFDPTFALTASDTRGGKTTGISATVTMPTADQPTQQSHVRDISVTLPAGAGLDLDAVNAITAICSEAQFAGDSCPAASQIGTAKANVPFLPSEMTGAIYLMNKTGFKFGYVLRGARGTTAMLRGSAAPATSGPGGLRATFQTLPQVPFSSATLDFTSKLVRNPTSCEPQVVYANILGYTGGQSTINKIYPITECIPPPDTTIVSGPAAWSRTATPSFWFSASQAGAGFECSVDNATFAPCTAPFVTPTLTNAPHSFQVRAVNENGTDKSPAFRSFTVDTVKPTLTVQSPIQDMIISNGAVTIEYTAEVGATVSCSFDSALLFACGSPSTHANLSEGTHSVLVSARDAAGNYSVPVWRNFTIASPPVINITSPVNGSELNYDGFDGEFTVDNPSGIPLQITCRLRNVTKNDNPGERYCESPFAYESLIPHDVYEFIVTATDEAFNVTEERTRFTAGIPMPEQVTAVGGANNTATTDRTPTFVLQAGTDAYHPTVDFECALVTGNATPVYESCGSAPESTFTPAADLPNGSYILYTRSRAGAQVTTPGRAFFSVADWSATYTATTSTSQAGGHPDLDFKIKSDAGQLRSLDLLLPKGLIGSLNSFPKCPLDKVLTAYDCPPETQVGSVKTNIKIVGLSINAVGEVFLTEPQQPGDVAGLTIFVHTPLSEMFENVVIPLRLQLVNNSQYLRTFSDSIPISTPYHVGDTAYEANFFVKTFDFHLNGSAGSPFPLLTNPSSCSPLEWNAELGDIEANHTAATTPFQATGCDTVEFAPTLSQTLTNPVASETSGVRAVVELPAGHSSLKAIHVLEPSSLTANPAALGAAADKCAGGAVTTTADGVDHFNVGLCPAISRIGTMSIVTPVLPRPVVGKVYLINKTPLPWLGVVVDDAELGVKLNLVGRTSTPKVDPTCSIAVSQFCQTQISIDFAHAPDLPVSSVTLDMTEGPRTVGAKTLSGEIFTVSDPGDENCIPDSVLKWSIEAHSGAPTVSATDPSPILGC